MLDKNGYAPSIVQADISRCFLCSRTDEKLDRHEIFGGSYRTKSKNLGLWVTLCHNRCHLYGVHKYNDTAFPVKQEGQKAAMKIYGWSQDKFIKEFGKNYL